MYGFVQYSMISNTDIPVSMVVVVLVVVAVSTATVLAPVRV